jgi:hypothetical protein
VKAKSSSLEEETPRKIRIKEAAQIAGCSERTIWKHLPYFKSYLLALPGKSHGRRMIDHKDFCAYLERHAQGLTNLASTHN